MDWCYHVEHQDVGKNKDSNSDSLTIEQIEIDTADSYVFDRGLVVFFIFDSI